MTVSIGRVKPATLKFGMNYGLPLFHKSSHSGRAQQLSALPVESSRGSRNSAIHPTGSAGQAKQLLGPQD